VSRYSKSVSCRSEGCDADFIMAGDRALALQALDARVTKPTTGETSTSAPPPTAPGTTTTAASGEAVTVTAPAEAVTKAEKASEEEIKAS
jgi:hypothetical protein